MPVVDRAQYAAHVSAIRRILYGLAIKTSKVQLAPIAGGDTHEAYRVEIDERLVFVKISRAVNSKVLESEYRSLQIMLNLGVQGYPEALSFEVIGSFAYLIMTHHQLTPLSAQSGALLAKCLVDQHRVTAPKFGWHEDNFIGLSPQPNQWQSDWGEFFVEQRLKPQLTMASLNGLEPYLVADLKTMIVGLPSVFYQYRPDICLLHGDLWQGNVGFDKGSNKPALFDPAPYFGDREVDIAMSKMFGGFPSTFYRTYQQSWPMERNFHKRSAIYNLYHALNHVSLFGQTYNGLVRDMLKEIAE